MSMTEDTVKYGVALPESLADEIEAPLEYGDSRSRRIRNLIRLGLAAEKSMGRVGYWERKVSDRENTVEKAVEWYLKEDH